MSSTSYIGLLRGVNVGGVKLKMDDLRAICGELGFGEVRTYIASGNVVFTSDMDEPGVKAALEARLEEHMGKPLPVMVRTAAEMAAVRDANPFPEAPGNRAVVVFLDQAPPTDPAADAVGSAGELVQPGEREIYIRYTDELGQGNSKLRVPSAAAGTARNMNTVAKLAEMAAG